MCYCSVNSKNSATTVRSPICWEGLKFDQHLTSTQLFITNNFDEVVTVGSHWQVTRIRLQQSQDMLATRHHVVPILLISCQLP